MDSVFYNIISLKMSKYIPPSARKAQTTDQKLEAAMAVVHEGNDRDFPQLSNTVILPKAAINYGAKALEWEQKRLELEMKERVDARMAEILEEKRKAEQAEYATLHPFSRRRPRPTVAPAPEPEPEPEKVVDEWIKVERKIRKPKKEKVEEEEEFNYDHLAQDQESD